MSERRKQIASNLEEVIAKMAAERDELLRRAAMIERDMAEHQRLSRKYQKPEDDGSPN